MVTFYVQAYIASAEMGTTSEEGQKTCSLFGGATVLLIGPCLAIQALQTGFITINKTTYSVHQSIVPQN